MSIKGGNSSGLTNATAADFTILNNTTTGRWVITMVNLHEYGGTGDTVGLYVSANASTVAAERVDSVVLAANETKLATAVSFNIEPGDFLLGNAVTGNLVNVIANYTAYDGDS